MSELSPKQVADAYIAAYNDNNIDGIAALLDDNVYLTHYNRGFETNGRDETIALYEASPAMIPDKQLTDRIAIFESGDKAVVQHKLKGTPAVDTPFAAAGEPIDLNLITVFTVQNGRVVKYEDYG